MMNGRLSFRRHPLLGYFALTCRINRGGILIVLAVSGLNTTVLRPLDTGLILACMRLGRASPG